MALPGYVSTMAGNHQRQTALITGASSGIGYDLAQIMAADFNLIVTARNQKKLEQLAQELEARHGNQVHVIPADLALLDAPSNIFAEIGRRGLQVDALVNNAGFGNHGQFKSTVLQDELQMIQVNITALTHLTKLALPGMLERKRGRILNVASTAGFQPGPLMAVYYATKAYVISFSEAIDSELKGTGITVSCLCPGPTATEFAARAEMEKSRLFLLGRMRSEDVARAGYKGMLRGKRLVVPGIKNKVFMESVRFTPRKLVTAIARNLNASS